jgi:hypothetical protein
MCSALRLGDRDVSPQGILLGGDVCSKQRVFREVLAHRPEGQCASVATSAIVVPWKPLRANAFLAAAGR